MADIKLWTNDPRQAMKEELMAEMLKPGLSILVQHIDPLLKLEIENCPDSMTVRVKVVDMQSHNESSKGIEHRFIQDDQYGIIKIKKIVEQLAENVVAMRPIYVPVDEIRKGIGHTRLRDYHIADDSSKVEFDMSKLIDKIREKKK